jgi:hypothetical protein
MEISINSMDWFKGNLTGLMGKSTVSCRFSQTNPLINADNWGYPLAGGFRREIHL